MATITNVEKIESTYNGKKKTSYKFTLDDGKVGYVSNDKPWEFKQGDNVDYTLEVKKSSKGEYNLFTFKVGGNTTQSTPTPQNAPQAAKTPNDRYFAELKFQLRRDVIKTIGEVAAAGRIEPKEMKEYYIDFCVATDSSIDDLKG